MGLYFSNVSTFPDLLFKLMETLYHVHFRNDFPNPKEIIFNRLTSERREYNLKLIFHAEFSNNKKLSLLKGILFLTTFIKKNKMVTNFIVPNV